MSKENPGDLREDHLDLMERLEMASTPDFAREVPREEKFNEMRVLRALEPEGEEF